MSKPLTEVLYWILGLAAFRGSIALSWCILLGFVSRGEPGAYVSAMVIAFLALGSITAGRAFSSELRHNMEEAANSYAIALSHILVALAGQIIMRLFGSQFLQ